ncbi:hypothetical protein Tco_1561902 [Tanacetum coccineum]
MEKWKNSSKGLNKLLDSQLNANDKAGLGHDGAKESKVSETITSVEDDEIMVKPKEVTKIIKPSFEKIESVNAKNETVRQAENPRKNNKRPRDSFFLLCIMVGKREEDYIDMICSLLCVVAWQGYKGKLLKGKFCFIQGDDYISTSGEALAL